MNIYACILVVSLFLTSFSSSYSKVVTLTKGSSLHVERSDEILNSPNGVFSAGFHPVGENAFSFAIWFAKSSTSAIVWMANRNKPVNGRSSRLSLLKDGDLILMDAGRVLVWSTNTVSAASVQLDLLDTGNLVLRSTTRDKKEVILWQSYDSPTDTLLPQQLLTADRSLVSSRSKTNFSSGFYTLYFDNDNVIRLLFKGPESSSVFWPNPEYLPWDVERTTYNHSRVAVLSSSGIFTSSDFLTFKTADFGAKLIHRRMTLDFDGNVRVYSLEEKSGNWVVSWQAIPISCTSHGICGPNSVCTYNPSSGRRCSCIPGFKIKNSTDWSYGCQPKFDYSCNQNESSFLHLPHVEFYGYDDGFYPNYTIRKCENICLQLCNCKAFLLKFIRSRGSYNCYPKSSLLNGYRSPHFVGHLYLKLPKSNPSYFHEPITDSMLSCPTKAHVQLDRTYEKKQENGTLKFLLWFACVIGGIEMAFIVLVWCFLFKAYKDPVTKMQGYALATTGFKRFSYAELRKATHDFREEIGRGGGGVVYKGILSDDRVAAIKRLHEANQGEAEFLSEASTIGSLNHMHLIAMWGYCAEGKHRLLVYEYMDGGSLAENLSSNALLGWENRFKIALGTAKGLAYLHEECLEWVLHCDIKPQNILLDSNYHPKVADFGMSKLLNREGLSNSGFSRIRGTRGYMAPEWVFNLPITSKVDVYSYGIVVLQMITGKTPAAAAEDGGVVADHRRLVTWLREKKNGANDASVSWIEEIIDPTMMGGECDMNKMEILVEVALKCVEDDKDARPSMSQVVKMLQSHDDA